MSRQIIIDEDTIAGYDFRLDKFYVINKNTTTYRSTTALIKEVLDIVAPSNTITIEDIQDLHDNYETLTETSYTLSNTGAYRASVQINDYSDNPIVVDADKQVLYIRNTELNFNLTLTESEEIRVRIIIQYFKDNFGILLQTEEVTNMYDFLINTYNPTVYNIIESTAETPILYSNQFRTSNYTGKGYVDCKCTSNPYNTFYKPTIAGITLIEPSYNRITYTEETSSMADMAVGDTVYISGTTTTDNTYSYTADGEYTINSIDTENKQIVTTEAVSSSYTFPYPQAYVILASSNIVRIDRENSAIQLASAIPNLLEIGSIITVQGTQQEIEGTTVSCDGTYTVSGVDTENRLLYVQEIIPTSYVYSTGVQATVSRHQLIGNIMKVETDEDTTITLTKNANTTISASQQVYIVQQDEAATYYSITDVINQATFKATVTSYTGSTPLTEYTPVYPTLQASVPDTAILIQVEKSENTELMPIGNFIVDNFEQCQAYFSLYEDALVPDEKIYNSIEKEVGEDISYVTPLYPHLTLLYKYIGLYSEVYKDES